jgi:hypothetical protein
MHGDAAALRDSAQTQRRPLQGGEGWPWLPLRQCGWRGPGHSWVERAWTQRVERAWTQLGGEGLNTAGGEGLDTAGGEGLDTAGGENLDTAGGEGLDTAGWRGPGHSMGGGGLDASPLCPNT